MNAEMVDDFVTQLCGKTHEELTNHGIEFESVRREYARKALRRGLTIDEEMEAASIDALQDILSNATQALVFMQSSMPWCIARAIAEVRREHK